MRDTAIEPSGGSSNEQPIGVASKFATYLGLQALLAMAVATFLLGRPSLWLDEASSIQFASGPWSELLDAITEQEAMHGFYYVVLKLWSGIAGTSEFASRLPSAIFFVVAVVALVLLGRLLFSDRVALIAGMLLTFNPFLLVYARDARSYAMVTALSTLATYLFVRSILSDEVDLWILGAYTFVGILSVYAHAWSIFVLVVHAGTLLVVPSFRTKAAWLIGSWSMMFILATPLLTFLVFLRGDQVAWIPEVGLSEFIRHFRRHSGSGILMAIFFGLVLIALWTYAFGDRRSQPKWMIAMIIAWILVPPVLTFLVSLSVPLFLSRYLIVALPALVLLAAVGVDALRPTWLGIGMAVVVVALSMSRNVPTYTSHFEDWRAATDFILTETEPNDVIVFFPARFLSVPYEYYERRLDPDVSPETIHYDFDTRSATDARVETLVQAIADTPNRRTWIVISHDFGGGGESLVEKVTDLPRSVESHNEFEGPIRIILVSEGSE